MTRLRATVWDGVGVYGGGRGEEIAGSEGGGGAWKDRGERGGGMYWTRW